MGKVLLIAVVLYSFLSNLFSEFEMAALSSKQTLERFGKFDNSKRLLWPCRSYRADLNR